MSLKLDELVAAYVKTRDAKAQIKAEYEAKVAKHDEVMAKIEAKLLEHLNESGSESVRTAAGTAYRTIRTTASVADRDAFLGYIQANEAWELLESRCAKKAVEDFIENSGGELPPGINVSRVAVCNIRRSN